MLENRSGAEATGKRRVQRHNRRIFLWDDCQNSSSMIYWRASLFTSPAPLLVVDSRNSLARKNEESTDDDIALDSAHS